MDSHFDNLIDRFESELKSGKSAQIESYLSQLPEDARQRVLLELVSLEVFYRIKLGQPVRVSDYARFGQEAAVRAEKTLVDNGSTENGAASNQITSNEESTGQSSRMIGPYKLLQQIGEGGMGTVWMAEQEEPVKRHVALKLVKSELASKEVIARFDAEKHALSMMDHHNIARVLDAGTTDSGTPYFVMELVKGIPITQYCDNHKLSVDERLKLFLPVCKAVYHAHQKGIIHRDLKPSNILVTLNDDEAVPKVIDFGLAKATEHTMKLTDKTMFTEFGKIVGTLQYMSPEQAEMNELDIDTRTDVYSLGVVLYELLTGSTPLEKDTLGRTALFQVLENIREQDPPCPSNRLSSSSVEARTQVSDQRQIKLPRLQKILKGDLDWVVMKALEKDRTRRYRTASDFGQDISNYLTGEVVSAGSPSVWYRSRKFVTKNRGLVVALLAGVFVLVAAFIGARYGRIPADQDPAQPVAKQPTTDANNNGRLAIGASQPDEAHNIQLRAAAAEKRASELQLVRDAEAASKIQLARKKWDANQVLEARNLLNDIAPEYRDEFQWRFLDRRFRGSDHTWDGHTDWAFRVVFSPDGSRIASASRDQTVKLWDSKTGQEIATFKGHTASVGSVAFSPDGLMLVTASADRTIKLWNTQSFQEINTLEGHTSLVADVVFSPDDTRLASSSDDQTIKLWNVQSGQEVYTLEGHAAEVGRVVFSPDGSQLASASVDKTVKLWDVATGEEITTINGHEAIVICVVFSPDGAFLAFSNAGTVKLWDVRSRQVVNTFRGHSGWVHGIAFSPDGMRLASASTDKTIKLWDVHSGQELITLKGHTHWVNGVNFSADGTCLASASADNTVKLWDARSGPEVTTLQWHSGTVTSVTFGDGDSRIYSESNNEKLVWDVVTRKPVPDATWDPPAEPKRYSSCGRWYVTREANNVLIVDVERCNFAEDGDQTAKSKFDSRWHHQQARAATTSENWYAAAFHYAFLIKQVPDQTEYHDGLESSYQKLITQFETEERPLTPCLAPVVTESLKLGRGSN